MISGRFKIMIHPGPCLILTDPYRHGYDPPLRVAHLVVCERL